MSEEIRKENPLGGDLPETLSDTAEEVAAEAVDTVGETVGNENEFESEGLDIGRDIHIETPVLNCTGCQFYRYAYDAERTAGLVIGGRIYIKVELSAHRLVRYAGDIGRQGVTVAAVQLGGLDQRHLDGDGHNGFLAHEGVLHLLVVGINSHIVGGELVGSAESETEVAVRI